MTSVHYGTIGYDTAAIRGLARSHAFGLGALAAIASIVTGNHLPRHTMAAALTDGYVAGLLAGAIIVAAGALVAVLAINAPVSREAARH